jgi:hypothetical protein
MANIADFANDIAYMYPDAPLGLLQEGILDAVTTLLQDTGVATDFLTLKMEAGQSEYLLLLPECRVIVSVNNVKYQQQAGFSVQRNIPFEMVGNMEAVRIMHNNVNVAPVDCYPSGCNVSCEPPCEVLVEVDYAWKPAHTACKFPDAVLQQYRQPLINMVRYFMYRMDKQEWSDLNKAQYAYLEYQSQLDEIRANIFNKFTNTPRMLRGAYVTSNGGAWNTSRSGRR